LLNEKWNIELQSDQGKEKVLERKKFWLSKLGLIRLRYLDASLILL